MMVESPFISSLTSERSRFSPNTTVNSEASGRLESWRNEAWSKVQSAGLPTTRHESFKFTSLRPLAAIEATLPERSPWEFFDETAMKELHAALDPNGFNLVFVDGVYADELSGVGSAVTDCVSETLHRNIQVDNLAAILNGSQAHIVENALIDMRAALTGLPVPIAHVADQERTIENLNQAFLNDGALIRVDPNCAPLAPLRLIHVQSGRATASFSQMIVIVGENSRVRLSECHVGLTAIDPDNLSTFVTTNIHLSRSSNVRYDRIISRRGDFHFGRTNVIVPANATFHSLAMNLEAKIARHEILVMVTGEGAEVVADGLTSGCNHQTLDTHSVIDHRVANTTSRQLYKSLLKDNSRVVFSGKIFVRKAAQKTAAFQQSRSLLLSDSAEIDAKPQLEIEADDVRCSHGATVAQLNADELFYLRSRGLPKVKAEEMLCNAFAAEIWQTSDDNWFESLTRRGLSSFLKGASAG
jgi:Fe-S cluster assembly protein SufD